MAEHGMTWHVVAQLQSIAKQDGWWELLQQAFNLENYKKKVDGLMKLRRASEQSWQLSVISLLLIAVIANRLRHMNQDV